MNKTSFYLHLFITILFSLLLAIGVGGAVLAQDAQPPEPDTVNRPNSLFLPLVNSTTKSTTTETGDLMVVFVRPMDIKQVLAWATRNNVEVLEINHSFEMATSTHVGGYAVTPGMSDDAIANDYVDTLTRMYQVVRAETAANANFDTAENASGADGAVTAFEVRQAEIDSLLALVAANSANIYAASVTNQGSTIEELMRIPEVLDVSESLVSPSVSEQITGESVTAADCSSSWWPSSGKVSVQSSNKERYVHQEFKWKSSNLDNLKKCKNVTYEAEAWFDNSDKKLFLGDYKSYSSDLPKAYKDTNFADGSKERGYTVGTAKASDLKADKSYYTLIFTKNGNADKDQGKLNGQRGERSPSDCYSTWCIWPKATEKLVKAWEVPAPGSKEWKH